MLSANAVTAAVISASVPVVGPALGTAYKIAADALAIASASASTASILKLQRSGIAYGPSREEGGIPLYRNGRPAGIEIAGGEPVLTKNVTANPLLLSLASTVNQLAGGRALAPGLSAPHMALGGVGPAWPCNNYGAGSAGKLLTTTVWRALARIKVQASIVDVKNGLGRDAETQRLSNG